MKLNMKPGDLVRYQWPSFLGDMNKEFERGIGIVLEVEVWQDSGSDKNCGINVDVLWPDGTVDTCMDDELVWVSGGDYHDP